MEGNRRVGCGGREEEENREEKIGENSREG